ncbi:MAG: hypothetical protein E4H03_01385 [Myxococcales bacterium]|nr:MAG: hypothetical protein E4H03_01385 [Myxococcales bacterium]
MSTSRDAETRPRVGRRDFLKLGASAAILGVGASALDLGVAARTANAASGADLRVDITDAPELGLAVVGYSIDAATMKKAKTKPKKAILGNARLTFRPDPVIEDQLRSWVDTASAGTCLRRDISITLTEPATAAHIRTFNLFECFPVAWSFDDVSLEGGGEALRWTLEVRVNRWECA